MDRATTTWEVWQGLSFGCVQCHSHPYDPIKHEEYYDFLAFFNNTVDDDTNAHRPVISVPQDVSKYPEMNTLIGKIHGLEKAAHDFWIGVDRKTEWLPVNKLEATSKTAAMSVVAVDEFAEFRADDNAKSKSTYLLTATPPPALKELTAFRLTYLPKNEKTALTDAEWGASLEHIALEKISTEGKSTPVALTDVIPDEPHPEYDPLNSLREKGSGWGTHYKFFRPRHATFVLGESLTLAEGETLRFRLRNGGTYLSSFPMVAKRGRIALTGERLWISGQSDPALKSIRSDLASAKAAARKIPSVKTPVMREREPEQARIISFFERGNWLAKGDPVTEANVPHVFPPLKKHSEKADRLDLANWIASPENPLTARVAVNRFWLEMFGIGIVPTPEDFGSAGEKPTHPELLDTLAVEFSTDMNWSVKTLLRKFVTSATYRQANTVTPELYELDADNRLLARGPRQRLTGEMARDTSLAVAGFLNRDIGGSPVFPPLPPGVWKPFDGQKWDTPAEGDPQRYRRALYIFWKRSIPYPTFMTFDAPSREMCSKRRMPSNTPVQALAVMNDPAFHECSKGLARRMKNEAEGDLSEKLSFGYRAATSRTIDSARLAELTDLFNTLEETYKSDPTLMQGLAATPDGAAFTVVASVLLNLDETLSR